MKNRLYTYTLLLLCGILILTACKKEITPIEENSPALQDTSAQDEEDSLSEEDYIELKEIYPEDYSFPKTGNTAEDFIPKQGNFVISDKTTGDLNNDGLEDIVFVLRDHSRQYKSYPMLVLLQNNDGSYHLDKVSKLAMPSEYFKAEYYEEEEISIENGVLKIELHNERMSGSMGYTFTYREGELYLYKADTYSRGAGTHTFLNVNFFKGEIKFHEEFGDEETGSKIDKTFKITPYQYTFEKSCPQEVLNMIYKDFISDLYNN